MHATTTLEIRTDRTTQDTLHHESCRKIGKGDLIISRTAFISSLTICIFITGVSLLALTILLYREHQRRRQLKQARNWGRQSRLGNRISAMRKEIDDSFRRQYSGCLVNEPENPEMGSDSPIELMLPERIWEAPAVPAAAKIQGKSGGGRKSKVGSLFFDNGIGLWMPKR